MTDREIDELLWRAFYFGLRVMAAREGKDVSFAESAKFAGLSVRLQRVRPPWTTRPTSPPSSPTWRRRCSDLARL
jgi:hypothetical protein